MKNLAAGESPTILQVASPVLDNKFDRNIESTVEEYVANSLCCDTSVKKESQKQEDVMFDGEDLEINQNMESIKNKQAIASDVKLHLKQSLDLPNINHKNKDYLFDIEHSSSGDSSCVNSPTNLNFNNGTTIIASETTTTGHSNMLAKEYNSLKLNYQGLQIDYQNSLDRESELCKRLQEYGGQDDESCNSLASVNNELRVELEKVLEELARMKQENKRLQEASRSEHSDNGPSIEKAEALQDIMKLEKIISELETENESLTTDRDNAKEKLAAHDSAAKRAITTLQKELTLRVDKVTKMYEDVVKEKDTLIVKIAKLEASVDNHKKKTEVAEKRAGESKKDLDKVKSTMKQNETDFLKLQTLMQEKDDELNKHKEELLKLKDDDSGQMMKVKWAQNKLKQELEAHKETKAKLAQASAKIDEAKEEGEHIRAACQEMIKKYQNSEEMRSNQLDMQLKEKDNALKIHEHEIAVQDEMHRMRTRELEALKEEHRKAMSEISQLKTTISMLEGKWSNLSIKNEELEKKLEIHSKKAEEANLTDKLLNDANKDLKTYKSQVCYYVELEDRLRKQLLDIEAEANESKKKETELLSFTEKITENNAHWKSRAFDLQCKVDQLVEEVTNLRKMMLDIEQEKKIQNDKVRKQAEEYEISLEDLVLQLEQKRKLVEQLTMSLEEAQDEVKVQKRKSTSTIKDLQRQLQHSRKRLEQLEETLSNSQENIPRTSSTTSLDRLSSDSAPQVTSSLSNNHISNGTTSGQSFQSPAYSSHYAEYSIVQPFRQPRGHSGGEIEVDKAVLVDRICRLQKAHAKKNEKIEFMEEHISSLIEEMKKKNKIVQNYVMREESGMLASNKFDRNKAEMSKKGGIMASVYSSHVSDKHMTIDLSLEINRKLQAVLEDTLLKNMTLKENVNTLGTEIARLQDDLKRSRR
eukprot:gene5717-6417_t